jgi:Domain of unknown function (DUF4124)
MLSNMRIRACVLLSCLFALTVDAETVYKYRAADGTVTYSNRQLRNAELIETFEYKIPAATPAAPRSAPPQAGIESDKRMKVHLSALNKAWDEVQSATRALAAAESRLAAGDAPLEPEGTSLGGPVALAPSEIGGPQAPASPAAGGPQPPATPQKGQTQAQAHAAAQAVGGPMGTRRGGGRNAEYFERRSVLEADVAKARTRLDRALSDYNQLR